MPGREIRNGRQDGNKWVQKAFGHNKGALHEELGVGEGKKIPLSKLHKAEHSDDLQLKRRAQLAENARHFNHK